ncbi:hypothetical protein LSAT2_010649 [Lamellibrachia satsuma]|nr:hypothetical protein LSAT2_010649 [Lamellibrachia satsuma]
MLDSTMWRSLIHVMNNRDTCDSWMWKRSASYGAEKRLKRAQLQLVRDSKESRVESVDEPAVSTTSSATTPTMPTRMVVGESNWPSASQDENVCN